MRIAPTRVPRDVRAEPVVQPRRSRSFPKEDAMVTIVTEIQLKKGAEPKWDAVMRERMVAATEQPGWVGGQLLQPEDDPHRRVIVGTWRSRGDWEHWHTD